MSTLRRKHMLWAGPEDGRSVELEAGTYAYFVPGPEVEHAFPVNPDAALDIGPQMVFRGRYEYNTVTKRFEWRGYE